MYKLYFEWKWEGHRVDSNHRRTGTIPIPSDLLKVDALIYFCRHGALPPIWKPCLPTDFAFRFFSCRKRSAPYLMVHRGRLSATSPAHHRMVINHLLQRFYMMPFLGLVATQRGKYDYYSKSCGRSYLPFYKGFPLYLIFQVWASRSRTYGEHYLFELKTYPCLPYI